MGQSAQFAVGNTAETEAFEAECRVQCTKRVSARVLAKGSLRAVAGAAACTDPTVGAGDVHLVLHNST